MTDREYEKMMVEAVNGGVDISHVMHVLNTKIAVAEQMVESLYETRRELINRFNLNKPAPTNDDFDGDYRNGDFYEGAE
ncbi:TPA: hypothetical protein ACXIWI_004047 [Escherichia coli]|nr:MAG TPA: hypothetical protein [Caudoviricetes sp.]